jgi:mono/diheme cytochrome c family protein
VISITARACRTFLGWQDEAHIFVARGGLVLAISIVAAGRAARSQAPQRPAARPVDRLVADNATRMIEEGRRTFRYDTFGDESFWTDTLHLNRAIAGTRFGGVGNGVSPKTALSVGLKVDVDSVPPDVAAALRAGRVDLDDPASTMVLLKANAVVGVTGHFDNAGNLTGLGVQCALCHSTVDDSFAPGIGHRLDAWANRDLNVGAIVSLAPDLSAYTKLLGVDEATVKKVLASWGPGKFDAELNLDGKAFRPDGKPAATLIPPAFGLVGVNLHTWGGGWGTVTYWNAFVANLEMQGRGNFWDPRLTKSSDYPVAAKAGFGNKRSETDMVTAKLGALEFYQLAIPAPKAAAGSFDAQAASRGRTLFAKKARCATCHVPPLFTEPGWNVHKADEIGVDDFQAMRAPDHSYRTAPLRGLMSHAKGGFYHDGRFADLMAVINHYDQHFKLTLTDGEKRDLAEYLKSL